nr:MAG TPA: lytic transglycosylase [Caudoviricetes sp.]
MSMRKYIRAAAFIITYLISSMLGKLDGNEIIIQPYDYIVDIAVKDEHAASFSEMIFDGEESVVYDGTNEKISVISDDNNIGCDESDISLSTEEIELIALVTMAEAEGEPEEGKRLVIDTILNRVDFGEFPSTVTEVIYQPEQFSSMWNGRIDECYVMEEICQLVEEELKYRLNNEVMFFTAGGYGKFGTPMFQVGNHYFSSY